MRILTSCGGLVVTEFTPTLTVVMMTKANMEYTKYSRKRLQSQRVMSKVHKTIVHACRHAQVDDLAMHKTEEMATAL